MNLKKKTFHFIGAGGVGVNALAKFCIDCGATVSGSDRVYGDLCAELEALGAVVAEGECPTLAEEADTVVYSSAISQNNSELVRARELEKNIFERQELLGEVSRMFGQCVAIAGTHGKTTVTATVAHILKAFDVDFVAMIGGQAINMGNYVNNTRAKVGVDGDETESILKKSLFVTEACEYKRNLLTLYPDIAIVTNAECDHPDCYADLKSVKEVYGEFLSRARFAIAARDDAELLGEEFDKHNIFAAEQQSDISYGVNEYSLLCLDRRQNSVCEYSCTARTVGAELQELNFFENGSFKKSAMLHSGGSYSAYDALCAVAVCACCGIKTEDAAEAVESFCGVKRRFEYAGTLLNKPVYFDFAHHPTEIRCALLRARAFGRILAVFQPHTYSRTKAYFADFVEALGNDENGIARLVVMPTYAARETSDKGCDSDVLADAIKSKFAQTDLYVAQDELSTMKFVEKCADDCDVIIFIGAGDIYKLKSILHFDA